MAVTVVSNAMYRSVPPGVAEIELSGLTAGETETVSFPTINPGAELKSVQLARVKTEATSKDPVRLATWSSDESNTQFTCVFDTNSGGDLTGAVVILHLEWKDAAAQDGSSIGS